MRQKLQDELNKNFPNLFRESDPENELYSTQCCECNDGWYEIIREMCEQLSRLDIPELYFQQIKEKWGMLRVYIIPIDSEIVWEIIRNAEEKSLKTCEDCGSTGGVSARGPVWIRSLCKECRQKRSGVVKVSSKPD